jgi:Flp pilus assembly protein TadB
MNSSLLLNISLLAIAFCTVASIWYSYSISRRNARIVQVLADTLNNQATGLTTGGSALMFPGSSENDIQVAIEKEPKRSRHEYRLEQFFRAGLFRKSERDKFLLFSIISYIFIPLFFIIATSHMGFTIAVAFGVVGILAARQLPICLLDRIIKKRDYEILYYLPLEVEKIVIGVSGSLDIGPCIQNIVSMADERMCHNPVTELLRFVQHYVKAGALLSDALIQVGRLSCHTELKHTFMAVSQVSRHGGEISRQLQQLADSVSQLRETKIDAKVKKLELEATGPVALVFLSFMGILLIGLGAQVLQVLK